MNDLRTAAQQFVSDYENGDLGDLKHYARALRAALAQQEQAEPVAWMFDWDVYDPTNLGPDFSQTKPNDGKTWTPLYTNPPRREWQGLTPDAVFASDEIMAANASLGLRIDQLMDLVHAVEAALKEKNHG